MNQAPVHRTSSSKSSISQPSPSNPESNIIQSRPTVQTVPHAQAPADQQQRNPKSAAVTPHDPAPVVCLPSRVAPGSATAHGIQQQLARAAVKLTKPHTGGEPVPPVPATQAESSLRSNLLAPHRAVSTFDYQSQANGTSLNHSSLHDSRHRAAHLFPPHFPINIPTPQNQHKSAKVNFEKNSLS